MRPLHLVERIRSAQGRHGSAEHPLRPRFSAEAAEAGDCRRFCRGRSQSEIGRARMRAALALLAAAFLSVAAAPPAAIRLNQLGLLADGPKRAMFANASKTPLPWQLVDSSGRVEASGTTEPFGNDR